MGETFELCFFVKKHADSGDIRSQIEEFLGVEEMRISLPRESRFRILRGRELLFDAYEEEDFIECFFNLDNVRFTRRNYGEMFQDILAVVDEFFARFPATSFATGIYEITTYYLQDITCYADFDAKVLSPFPFLFLREKKQFGISQLKRHGSIWYKRQKGKAVQNIF